MRLSLYGSSTGSSRGGWLVPAILGLFLSAGCDDSSSELVRIGRFLDSPVSGLNYSTPTTDGLTGEGGTFHYRKGEAVTFAIGALGLGSAVGAELLTPLNITVGATKASDPAVNNRLILLQTLDADGDLNNGIQITEAIRTIVSGKAASIAFDQDTAAFRSSLAELMTELNGASVFTDTDPRPRTVRTAVAALQHFTRSTSERRAVVTQHGAVSGYAVDDSTWQFLAIPYAKPPLGELRWKPPQPATPWAGIRDAVAWSDQAAQAVALEKYGEGGMSEDCLYLNVTTPKNAAKLPVMVWFHGGGFTALTSNTPAFNNASSLPTKGVVLVSVNHRLGPFGYMAHPLLSAESGYGGSGNYGQMDLIAALTWVRHNIARFGGDPGNVTIFGESGGGRKTLSLMASPLAKGLFHKAISQSGTLIPDTRSLAAAEEYGTALSNALNVTTLEELRAKPWTEIVTAAAKTVVPYTNVDGHYLPDTERVSFETRKQNDVPFMIVVNTNDNPDPIGTFKNVLPWMSEYASKPMYATLFSQVPAGWAARGVTAYHGVELLYVFNLWQSALAHFQLGLVIDPATGKSLVIDDLNGNGVTGSAGDTADVLASIGFDATDSAVADTVMTVWTNFAKTGVPGTATFTWPAYTKANDTYVNLGSTLKVETGAASVFP